MNADEIVMRVVLNLIDHPLMAEDPVWEDTDPRMLELAASIAQAGVLQPLLIDDSGRVGDGRHRLRAARLAGLKFVPCRVLDEGALVEAMLDSECHRKHRTKTALAYRACIYAEAYAEMGMKRRVQNLKAGAESPTGYSIPFRENIGKLEDFASKIGVSRETLRDVKSVWDFVHEHPEEGPTREGYESLKHQIEHMVYEEGAGSNAIRDVIRGVIGRNSQTEEGVSQAGRNAKRHVYVTRALKAMDKHFASWEDWGKDMRLHAMKEIHAHVKAWPEDIKAQFRAALGDGEAV
jgi:hypothetical protein